MTLRKTLIAALAVPRTASSLARELGMGKREMEGQLRHALRSARAAGYEVVVTPARCRTCGFTFGEEKLLKPGKCPSCRGSRLQEATITLVAAADSDPDSEDDLANQ